MPPASDTNTAVRTALVEMERAVPAKLGAESLDCKSFESMFHILADNPTVCTDFVLLHTLVIFSRLQFAAGLYSGALDPKVSTRYDPTSVLSFVPIDVEYPEVTLHAGNFRMVWLACACIAAKFVEDIPHDNYTFSTLGSVSLEKLNEYEFKILTAIRFDVGVRHRDISDLCRQYRIPSVLMQILFE